MNFFDPMTLLAMGVGVLFIAIFARIIKKLILEIAFFGGIFGLVDTYHHYLVPAFGFPDLPNFVFIAVATAFFVWAFVRTIRVLAIAVPFAPFSLIDRL